MLTLVMHLNAELFKEVFACVCAQGLGKAGGRPGRPVVVMSVTNSSYGAYIKRINF